MSTRNRPVAVIRLCEPSGVNATGAAVGRWSAYCSPSWTAQLIVDGISDERGRCFRLIVDDVQPERGRARCARVILTAGMLDAMRVQPVALAGASATGFETLYRAEIDLRNTGMRGRPGGGAMLLQEMPR